MGVGVDGRREVPGKLIHNVSVQKGRIPTWCHFFEETFVVLFLSRCGTFGRVVSYLGSWDHKYQLYQRTDQTHHCHRQRI